MASDHLAGLHQKGLLHHGRRRLGGYRAYDFDDCYWRRLNEPWLPYCY
jgi:DNA-binding transcriptional MerR regulator